MVDFARKLPLIMTGRFLWFFVKDSLTEILVSRPALTKRKTDDIYSPETVIQLFLTFRSRPRFLYPARSFPVWLLTSSLQIRLWSSNLGLENAPRIKNSNINCFEFAISLKGLQRAGKLTNLRPLDKTRTPDMKPFMWIIVWARQEPIAAPRHLPTLNSSWSVLSWPHHSRAPCFRYEVTCIGNALPCLGDELTMDTIKRRFLQVLKHSPNDKSDWIRTTAAVEDHVSPKRSKDRTSVMPCLRISPAVRGNFYVLFLQMLGLSFLLVPVADTFY